MQSMKDRATLIGVLGILASALVSAVLLVLAFPPYDYWFLAWVALVPMFVMWALPTPRPRAARAAAALTFVLYMGVLLWQAFPPGLTSRAWRGSDFPPILFLDSPALFVSVILLPTLFVLFYFVRVPTGPPVALAQARPYFWLLPPAVWTLTEYVRYRLQLGHIWGNLFTTQHTMPPAMVITQVGGPWLLTFCIVFGQRADRRRHCPAAHAPALRRPPGRSRAGRPPCLGQCAADHGSAVAGCAGTERDANHGGRARANGRRHVRLL